MQALRGLGGARSGSPQLYSRDLDFFNYLECSLSSVCYILYKNNINKNEKTFLK